MSEFNIIRRGRGRVLLKNGFEYYRLSTYKNFKTLWRCAMYKKTKCSGTVTTSKDEKEIVKHVDHDITCIPDTHKEVMSVIIHNSVNKMMLGSETVPAVYKKTVATLKDTGIPNSSADRTTQQNRDLVVFGGLVAFSLRGSIWPFRGEMLPAFWQQCLGGKRSPRAHFEL